MDNKKGKEIYKIKGINEYVWGREGGLISAIINKH